MVYILWLRVGILECKERIVYLQIWEEGEGKLGGMKCLSKGESGQQVSQIARGNNS